MKMMTMVMKMTMIMVMKMTMVIKMVMTTFGDEDNGNGDEGADKLSPIKAWVNVITRQAYNGFCSSWYQNAQWKKLFDIRRYV